MMDMKPPREPSSTEPDEMARALCRKYPCLELEGDPNKKHVSIFLNMIASILV